MAPARLSAHDPACKDAIEGERVTVQAATKLMVGVRTTSAEFVRSPQSHDPSAIEAKLIGAMAADLREENDA
jgi:hypothetical protein